MLMLRKSADRVTTSVLLLIVTLILALESAAELATSEQGLQDCPPRRRPISITNFGERPAFSPDSKQVAFMSKSYGDAFTYDIATGDIDLLTHYEHSGYLRVQYLPDGTLLLLGARTYVGYAETREKYIELWTFQPGDQQARPLEQLVFEGVAISRTNNHIAWCETHDQYPSIPEGTSILYTADIQTLNGTPSLLNKREIMRAQLPDCLLEPQDFRHNDTEIIYSCYRITSSSRVSDVRGVNVETGIVTVYRNVSKEYNEAEGIFPNDENFMAVESAHDQLAPDDNFAIEVWRLKLEADSRDFCRLTWLSANPGDKAGNPVASPDGRYMAFQLSKAEDEPPGAGFGLFLVSLQ